MRFSLIFLFIFYSAILSANDFELFDGKSSYQVLGVRENAKADDIQGAYRELIKKHHPDTGGDTETSQAIIRAYQTLHSPRRRAAYDRWLKRQRREKSITYTPERNFEDLFPEVALAIDDQCDVECAQDMLQSLILSQIPEFRLNYYLNKLFFHALLNGLDIPLSENAQIALGGAVIRIFQNRAITRAGSRDAHTYLNQIREELTYLKRLSSHDGVIAKALFDILESKPGSGEHTRAALNCGPLLLSVSDSTL